MARLAHPHPVKRAEQALHAYGAVRHPARWIEAQTNARIAHRPPGEERPGKGGSKQPAAASARGRAKSKRQEEAAVLAPEMAPEMASAVSVDRPATHVRHRHPAPHIPHRRPVPPVPPASSDPSARREDMARPSRPEQDSVVMKDAFAVQRGEKPKLGFDFKDPEP
jgi:hypothetical protein